MIQEQGLPSTQADAEQKQTKSSVSSGINLGQTLTALRQEKNVSIEDFAQSFKYAPRQVKALENQEWEKLPKDQVFIRGMVRSYARTFHTDEQVLLNLLASQPGIVPLDKVDPNTLLSSLNSTIPRAKRSSSKGNWFWFLLILVVVLIGLFYAFSRGWIDAHTLKLDALMDLFK